MSLLREPDELRLVDLHAQGDELIERYEALLASTTPPPPLASALRRVIADRRAVLEKLAERLRARDRLPPAGDAERAFFHFLADVAGTVAERLESRLLQAEERWGETLAEAQTLSWSAADQAALDELSEHMARSRSRIGGGEV